MGFVDSLRMNGLFGGNSGNPSQSLSPPIDGSPNFDAIARIINLVRGPMTQDRDANWNHENNLINQEHQNKLAEIAKLSAAQNGSMEPTPPMNVVQAPSAISPLDKAKLDLETADLNRKKKADEANLGVKQNQEEINQQKADTGSYRADTYHAIMDRKDISDSQKIDLMNKARLNLQEAVNTGRQNVEGMRDTAAAQRQTTKGQQDIQNIDERTKGQKEVAGVKADITKQVREATANQITQQTKTMMEGSQMLLPHVNSLRQQATDLEKRGLFGPVMSRVRDLAAKVGTTGSPEAIQSSLEDFANSIAKDPKLSTDAAVGQFVTDLGLMSSGAGRIHGGARGGGSIQMVNYMKGLLSADSTLPMFLGRLNSLEGYLKGYAAGPPKSDTNNKLDKALDKIFGKPGNSDNSNTSDVTNSSATGGEK